MKMMVKIILIMMRAKLKKMRMLILIMSYDDYNNYEGDPNDGDEKRGK